MTTNIFPPHQTNKSQIDKQHPGSLFLGNAVVKNPQFSSRNRATMKNAMSRPRKLKRTLTTIFHKRKKRTNGEEAPVSDTGREALSESTLSRASRSSFEYQRCCFPSWQHICRSRSPAQSLESSQTATASGLNDGTSLELIMEVQSNSAFDRAAPHTNTPELTECASELHQTVCSKSLITSAVHF